ncbi:TetR/AcrR family transcriptional regulator [Actinocrispum wychmicini]|nr:TetR/AcrR family transcriptional regulator [Actinocrispum wychmicini]
MTDTAGPESTRSRTLRRDAVLNRQRLLQAAREVYAEQGHDAGVDEIARRAGVGMGTLYRNFPTKNDLLRTLRQDLLADVSRQAAAVAAEQPPGDGLEACLWCVGTEMQAHHGYLTLLWEAFPRAEDPDRSEFWQLVHRLLDEAKDAGRIRDDLTVTDVFLTLLSIRALIDDTTSQAPGMWRRHLSVVLAGFRPTAAELEYPPTDDSLVEPDVRQRSHRGESR